MTAMAPASDAHHFDARQVFQWLSYLQYPALLVALGFALWPLFHRMQGMLDAYNNALLYAGVGIGMSSLQDPTKTQNKVSRKTWEDPRKGLLVLWLLASQALLSIVLGLLGTALADSTALSQLSLGMVAFGLGMVGLLKTAIEMREHHRLDKQVGTEDRVVSEASA
jgi:hypothetical protein